MTKRTLWRLAIGSVLVELLAWYVTRGGARRRYLSGLAKQVPHLPGRYAV